MKLTAITLGEYMTNCWLLQDERTGRALLVDPGFYTKELDLFLERNNVSELEYILLTHGHMDHICGVPYVKEKYGGKTVIGAQDAYLLEEYHFIKNEPEYENAFRASKADITVCDGDGLDFCGEKIKIMFTPGHTQGGVCYIINDMFFSGDVLFKGSIGRTDLEGGDLFRLVHSLQRIADIEKNYIVLPGHGEKTTLEFEKMTNRYLKAAGRKR